MDDYSYDTNADGVGDFTYVDSNSDGAYDTVQIDSDYDGYLDTYAFDVSADGTPGLVVFDVNEDGIDDIYQTGSWLDEMDNAAPTGQPAWTTSDSGSADPFTGNWGDNAAADWVASSNAALQGYGGVYYGAVIFSGQSPWG